MDESFCSSDRFSESNARARERRSRETRETSAPSFTRVAICVSRVLHDGLQKKERLLVVYCYRCMNYKSYKTGKFPSLILQNFIYQQFL